MRTDKRNKEITASPAQKIIRCGIYCRKSTEDGLEMEYNSLDAQREACESYIASQRHEGWVVLPEVYSDGGFTGANIERPALKQMIDDIRASKIDSVVTYKVDRLSRSLLDFAKLMELFDEYNVSFVSITQAFATNTSIGRLTLNILMSFGQFEREIIAERVRDKIAGAKRKGKYTGGFPVLGYNADPVNHKLIINPDEAKTVLFIFNRYAETGSYLSVANELNSRNITTKSWTTRKGVLRPGNSWNAAHIYRLLNNRIYIGETVHKDKVYPGEHEPIIPKKLWDRTQTMMKSNPPRSRSKHEAVPSLLRGVIRCGHCDCAMTNSFTRKGEKTYRYYICVKANKNGYSSCPVKTIPAGDIENAVVEQIRSIIRSPEMIAQTFFAACEMEPDAAISKWEVTDALQQFDPIWNELYPAEQHAVVASLVDKVSISEYGIDMRMRTEELHSVISSLNETRSTYNERINQ
ncbi:MAG: recombinase family protein [Armatimonadota bacterium]